MTRKITLSIPDILHEKMEEWRKSFNLSKMFQDALSEAIHKKEDFHRRIQEDMDMAGILERLKREKRQSEGNYVEKGHSEGLTWAKTAHYNDIIHALKMESPLEMVKDSIMGSYFEKCLKGTCFMDGVGKELDKYSRLFLEGWKKGLSDFWNEIKEKL